MNSTLTGPVTAYLAEVRAELSDLPPGELEDVVEDVTGHLAEVAAELDGSPSAEQLTARLGTPKEYADELRTAAGYPARGGKAEPAANPERALRCGVVAATLGPFFLVLGLLNQVEEWRVVFCLLGLAIIGLAATAGLRALRGHDPRTVLSTRQGQQGAATVRGLVEQLPANARRELRVIGQPVWWVARGAVAGGGFFAAFGAGAATVVGTLAGAAFSIWLGRRSQADRRWLWYLVPLNVVAAVVVPAWLVAGLGGGGSFGLLANSNYVGGYGVTSGLVLDGEQISNLYPFDEAGRPVRVRLYDQSGRPLNLELSDCAAMNGVRTGRTVSNQFPLSTMILDQEGFSDPATCQDTDTPPFVPPPAPATPTIRPTPSNPSAGPSDVPPTSSGPGATPTATSLPPSATPPSSRATLPPSATPPGPASPPPSAKPTGAPTTATVQPSNGTGSGTPSR